MGSRSGSQTTETRIDPRLVPFVEQGLSGAKSLFETGQIPGAYVPKYFEGQTFVGPSEQTQQAMQMAQQRAIAGSPLVSQAQQSLQQIAAGQGPGAATAAGQMLGMNPFLQGTIDAISRPLTQQFQQQIGQIAGGASRAGRYGSAAMGQMQAGAAESLAANLAGLGEKLGFQGYQLERNLQEQARANQQNAMLQAAQLAPNLADQDFMAAQRLGQVGSMQEAYQRQALSDAINRFNFQQEAPYRALQQYSSFLSGFPQGSQQGAPVYSNPAASLLGGAALVSAFNQPAPGETGG